MVCAVWLALHAASLALAQPGGAVPQLEADRVVLAEGAALPLRVWLPTVPARAAIVALHGLNEHSVAYEVPGERLAAGGYAVYAYDQRGFGATAQHGLWQGGAALARDARQVAALVRARHPGVPLYVMAESMGGAVLLRALVDQPRGWLDGAVLLAPAVWRRRDMPWYQRFALASVGRALPGLKVARPERRVPTDDPATLARLRADPLVIKKMRVDSLVGMANLMDEVTAAPSAIGVPLLILYGANDEIIPADPFCRWVGSLDPGGSWRLVVYPRGWHLLLRGLDAPTVMEDLLVWLADAHTPLPSGLEASGLRDKTACLALAEPTPPR